MDLDEPHGTFGEPQVLRLRHQDLDLALRVLHGHRTSYPLAGLGRRSYQVRAHAHDVYHVILYVDGAGHCRLSGQDHPVSRGTLVLCAPGEPHVFGTYGPERFTLIGYSLGCYGQESSQRLSVGELLGCVAGIDLPAVSYPVQLHGHALESVESAMTTLLGQLTRQDPLARFAEQCLLAELLRVVADGVYGPLLEAGVTPTPAPLVLVRDLITHQYWEPWTLDDLARSAGLSRAYLCRRFRREFGLPPMAYLHQVRLGAAKRLLQNTQLTVTEVALRVGYVDVYSFCKSFKRRTGLTPTEARAGHAG